jgi:hypothetical protein
MIVYSIYSIVLIYRIDQIKESKDHKIVDATINLYIIVT